MPEVDPYTDIVLSSCCTDYQQPNAKVTDQGRTITAIRGISKGEEVVTHSGAPHAALQSAGLVRLIASSTLARAMHMDIFASDDESEDERTSRMSNKRHRSNGRVEASPSAALDNSRANGINGGPRNGPTHLHSQPVLPPSTTAAAQCHPSNSASKRAASRNSGSSSHHLPPTTDGPAGTHTLLPPNTNGPAATHTLLPPNTDSPAATHTLLPFNTNGPAAAHKPLPPNTNSTTATRKPLPPNTNSTTASRKPLAALGKQRAASPHAPHSPSNQPPPSTRPAQACPQQEHQAPSHTVTNHEVSSHTTHTPQPSLPPPLLPPPWLHLQQNVYVGAAARVKACEGMGAESDDDLEGRGRGRKSLRGRGSRSPGKRAGQRMLKGGSTWKPFVCQCNPQQGKVCADEHSCLNRAQHVECTPGVCTAGELCQNQRIQRMQSPYLMLRHVGEEKGWGVLAGEPVPAGAFIIQYTGEVVTKEEADKRLQQYEALRIPHYYLMTLSNELVVDATRSGSLGRFVNHSSQPNCVTEKWLVEGREVVIITAKRDVAVGEELCYDYNCANQIWFSCL
uniref:SET domain-containing protein n=1 Tax=Dunaliella tertiolecta TaxID=3047 RepID=A0A7S3QLN8_DUNTE